MSKAIAIINKMPAHCYECGMQVTNIFNKPVCILNEKNANHYPDRPAHCPLRELPEKMPDEKMEELRKSEDVFEIAECLIYKGWNDCIDEIEGGGKNGIRRENNSPSK